MDNKQLPSSSDNRHTQQQPAVNAAEATNSTTTVNPQPLVQQHPTHSTTEEESPAFEEEPLERVLDGSIINDIVHAVTTRSAVSEEEVRKIVQHSSSTTIAHDDRIGNDERLEIGKVEGGHKLDLLCAEVAKDMAVCLPDEQKSGTEQNCSEEHVGVQPHSKNSMATKRPGKNSKASTGSSECRWKVPGFSQVSQRPLQALQLNRNNTNDKVECISLGPNNTPIPRFVFESIDFTNASLATRKLLEYYFDRETLATHSLTGTSSPAFKDKPLKKALNPLIIDDIIFAVTTWGGVSAKEVRMAITKKCADESKMWRMELSKKTDKEI